MNPRDLIETIVWYRDNFHKLDLGHNEMIRCLKPLVGKKLNPKEQKLVESIEATVESWLDIVPDRVEKSGEED